MSSEDCVRQPGGDLSTAGLASRAAKGSSSSIPYIDCSDAEISEAEVRGRVSRSHSRPRHRRGSVSPGSASSSPGRVSHDESPSYSHVAQTPPSHYPSPTQTSSPASCTQNYDVYEWSLGSAEASVRGILHSTLLDELGSRTPRPIRQPLGTRSLTSSPALFSFHRTGSLSHARANGHGLRDCTEGLASTARSFSLRSAPQGEKCSLFNSCSPIPNRSANLGKYQNPGNRSETDPLILSQPRPVLSLAERMGALERRMVANGLSAPGLPKSNSPHRRHSGMQMIDGSTSSGTDTSDSDEMESSGSFCQSLGFVNPAACSSAPGSGLPRNKLSFGSLQLDEDPDGGGVDFSDEEGLALS